MYSVSKERMPASLPEEPLSNTSDCYVVLLRGDQVFEAIRSPFYRRCQQGSEVYLYSPQCHQAKETFGTCSQFLDRTLIVLTVFCSLDISRVSNHYLPIKEQLKGGGHRVHDNDWRDTMLLPPLTR